MKFDAPFLLRLAVLSCWFVGSIPMEEREKLDNSTNPAKSALDEAHVRRAWSQSDLATVIKQSVRLNDGSQQTTCSDDEILALACRKLFDHIKEQSPVAFKILLLCTFLESHAIPFVWLKDFVDSQSCSLSEDTGVKDEIALLKRFNLLYADEQNRTYSLYAGGQEAIQAYSPDERLSFCEPALILLCQEGEKLPIHKTGKLKEVELWLKHAECFWGQVTSLAQKGAHVVGPNHRAKMLVMFAKAHQQLRNFCQALDYHRQAIQLLDEAEKIPKPHAIRASALSGVGDALSSQGHLDEALKHYRESLTIRRELAAPAELLCSLLKVGDTYKLLGKFSDALIYYKEINELRQRVGKDAADFDKLSFLENMTAVLDALGRDAESLKHSQEMVRLRYQLSKTTPT